MQDLGEAGLDEVLSSVRTLEEAEFRTVGDVIDTLGAASFMPLLLITAMLVVTPLSGVPGVSTASGTIIALVAGQLLWGRDSLWLPGWLMRREVPQERLRRALARLETPLERLRGATQVRLTFLSRGVFARGLLALCAGLGALMPFLELVPGLSTLLGAVIVMLTLSLLSRDGLFALAGLGAILVLVLILGGFLLS